MGGTNKQAKAVSRYVLESATGVEQDRKNIWAMVRFGYNFALLCCLFIILLTIIFSKDLDQAILLIICCLAASAPIGVAVQRKVIKYSLYSKRLVLQQITIGRKTYTLNRSTGKITNQSGSKAN